MKQVIDTRYILKINNKLFYRKGAGGLFGCNFRC